MPHYKQCIIMCCIMLTSCSSFWYGEDEKAIQSIINNMKHNMKNDAYTDNLIYFDEEYRKRNEDLDNREYWRRIRIPGLAEMGACYFPFGPDDEITRIVKRKNDEAEVVIKVEEKFIRRPRTIYFKKFDGKWLITDIGEIKP